MLAHLIGFQLHAGTGVSLAELMTELHHCRGTKIRFGDYDRLIYVSEKENHYLGLFITIKDQSRVPSILTEQGEYEIRVRSLTEESNVIDFNFFILKKSTGRGLYCHYHHSCSINQFALFCRRQSDALRDRKKNVELGALRTGNPGDEKKVRRRYNGGASLSIVVLVRPEKLGELLKELARVKSFQFDFETFTVPETLYGPVRSEVIRDTRRVMFKKDGDRNRVIEWIANLANSDEVGRGKIEGLEEDGTLRTFKLMDNPDSFGSYEYETIADETMLSTKDFDNSPFFGEMLDAMKANPHIFDLPAK